MFHGEMVCQPADAHPPKFVTDPCNGKQEGDQCEHFLMPGTCTKPKYMSDMYCKVAWPSKQDVTDLAKGFVKMIDPSMNDANPEIQKPKDEVVIV
jgi:hypothetical protein